MQQVKLLKGIESELAGLEGEVNAWIRQSGARVISITRNIAPQSEKSSTGSAGLGKSQFAPSDVILVVLYETSALSS
jgi:hypothetical protein